VGRTIVVLAGQLDGASKTWPR